MIDTPDDGGLMAEFDAFARRAQLPIPDDRRALLFQGFKDFRRELAMLRQPRTAASEPAPTYSMASITRTVGP